MVTILWDIDGPLNPYLATDLHEGFRHVTGDWISWRLDLLHHAAWMRVLETQATMVWVSTWAKDSNLVNRTFGLESEYAHVPLDTADWHEGETYKLPFVKRWLGKSGEPLIWIDDELEGDAVWWAHERPNTLLIHVNPSVGWTEAQYRLMLDFVAQHQPDEFSY